MNRALLRCLATLPLLIVQQTRADDWPQWMGPNRDGIWRETGIVEKFPEAGPTVRWRTKIGGGYAGPAVVGEKVYLADYLTDAVTGNDPNNRASVDGSERILCLDESDGSVAWEHKYPCPYEISYPAGPRATPTIVDGRLYSLGAEGDLFCLDAKTGDVHWHRALRRDYQTDAPIWGYSSHPLVDSGTVYVIAGGKGSVVVALDAETGKERWRALDASGPGYAPCSIIESGGTRQLLVWTADAVNSLDPATGKVYWTVPLEPGYGMAVMAPQQSGDILFAGGVNVSIALKLDADAPKVEELWRAGTGRGLQSVCSTPILEKEIMYGVDRHGQFRGVNLMTGEHLWETFAPTTGQRSANSGTAFLTKNGGRYFIFSETGDLIIAKLSPEGYEEVSRAHVIEPTNEAFGRPVVWSHPAYAHRSAFIRNDREIIAVSLEQ